jgi:hypothetical protein
MGIGRDTAMNEMTMILFFFFFFFFEKAKVRNSEKGLAEAAETVRGLNLEA